MLHQSDFIPSSVLSSRQSKVRVAQGACYIIRLGILHGQSRHQGSYLSIVSMIISPGSSRLHTRMGCNSQFPIGLLDLNLGGRRWHSQSVVIAGVCNHIWKKKTKQQTNNKQGNFSTAGKAIKSKSKQHNNYCLSRMTALIYYYFFA